MKAQKWVEAICFFLLLFHLFYFFFLSERQVNWWVFVNLNTFKYILRHLCVWVICYGVRAANFCASQRQSECRQFVFDVSVFGLRTHVLMEAAKWKRIWCIYMSKMKRKCKVKLFCWGSFVSTQSCVIILLT